MSFTTRPELRGTFGMVASTHWLASGAGMSVLERGGTRSTRPSAAGLVLQVLEPHLNGPGGDVPAIIHSAERDEVIVICGQGPAPAAATPERFAELGLDLIPGSGPLAAVVPGAFDAWMLMLRDFGTWELADVMEAAIGYARDGYPLVPNIRAAVAEAIQAWVRDTEVMDSSGRQHRGLLSGDDLAGWQATLEAPVTLDYHGHTICKTGPWGQGPVMLQQLALLAGFDLEAMGPGADLVHTVVECAELAFADREAWYGDPDFTDVPLAALLSAGYADERQALVGERASEELGPGAPDGREPLMPPLAAAGCTAPRSSPASASASARARRCSGSPRGCRTRSSRASGRAPR